VGSANYIVCGRHAERACLWKDGSLGDLASTPPFVLPQDFGEEWRKRALAADARMAPEKASELARRAALLAAFERRHRGCPLYVWSEGREDQPIRLSRLEAGWGERKGLAHDQEFDLSLDDPTGGQAPPGTLAPGRVDMVREINRRPIEEPTPIQWTRTKKPRQPRVVNRR
jgi:hypothetical protein